MTLSDWINDIRWKYFTNNKAGLIFKELMKEFQMVDKMTENKRFKLRYDESWVDSEYDNLIEDNNKIYTCKEVVDLLNNLTEENKQLNELLNKIIGDD